MTIRPTLDLADNPTLFFEKALAASGLTAAKLAQDCHLKTDDLRSYLRDYNIPPSIIPLLSYEMNLSPDETERFLHLRLPILDPENYEKTPKSNRAGRLVAAYREMAGYKQYELADLLDIHREMLSARELGGAKHPPFCEKMEAQLLTFFDQKLKTNRHYKPALLKQAFAESREAIANERMAINTENQENRERPSPEAAAASEHKRDEDRETVKFALDFLKRNDGGAHKWEK